MGPWCRARAWRLFDCPKASETLRETPPARTLATLRERLLPGELSGELSLGEVNY